MLNTKVTKAGLDMTELGRSGLNRMGGLIYEEFLRELSGTLKVKVYKEMAWNDPVIAAILFAIDMLSRQVPWRVQAVSEDAIDLEAAEFVESCMSDMSMTWEDVISEVFTMLTYGYAPLELVYKRRLGENRDSTKDSRFNDGRIGWRKMPLRAQDTLLQWKFDDEGGILAFVQQPPPDYRQYEIPIEKLLLFRTKSHKGNPEGESILRGCYCSWYKKKHIELIECIGIERDLAGLPIAYGPPEIFAAGATAEQKAIYNALKEIVTNVRRDEQEGILFPLLYDENKNLMYKFELLSTGGRRNFDTSAVIQRHNQSMAMTVLADFVFLGHGKAGSWSLVSSRTEMFGMALGAWLKGIASVFNRYAISRLFALNNIRVDKLPELVPGDIETPDLAELGDFISKLSGAGISFAGDDELENYLRQAANLPLKQADIKKSFFGHEGRPGHEGGSLPKGAGAILISVGKEDWPEHISALKIPPAWTDVRVSADSNASLLAIGKDSKGRTQYVYSPEFRESQSIKKFQRINELDKQKKLIDSQIDADLKSGDPRKVEHAQCAQLISKMGIRPGSDADTGAAKKAYGATTLQGRHVVTEGGQVRLQFTGKKGVAIDLPVADSKLAAELGSRAKRAGTTGKIFPHVNSSSMSDYTRTLDHGKFKTKDFRTLLATKHAREVMEKLPVPRNGKEYKKQVNAVAKSVASQLGNTATVALQSYINPVVFTKWRVDASGTV